MKLIFLIALLINIIFFLWEFNSGGLNLPQEIAEVNSHKTKQIILVSELSSQDGGESLKVAENKIDFSEQSVSLALNSAVISKAEEDAVESSQQLIKGSSTTIDELSEKLISSNEQAQDDQTEQNTLQSNTDTLAISEQVVNEESSKQLTKGNTTAIDELSENLISSNEQAQDDQTEQNILQFNTDTLAISEQVVNEESSKQLIKGNTTAIDELPEKLISSNEQTQNDQTEQNPLQHDTDVLATSVQKNDASIIPVLEEKPLTGEVHEEVIVNSLLNSDESNVEQAVPDNINYCYHVGPFANHNALNRWRKLNEIDKDAVSRFNKEHDVVSSYLVYYPAAETFAQSRKNVQLLKQKGITDYFLFRKGEIKGAISVGLFIKKSRALSLQEKLVKQGLTIEIKERYKKDQLLYAEILTKDKVFKDIVIISDKQGISECKNNTGNQE